VKKSGNLTKSGFFQKIILYISRNAGGWNKIQGKSGFFNKENLYISGTKYAIIKKQRKSNKTGKLRKLFI